MTWFIRYWLFELAINVMFDNIERNLCIPDTHNMISAVNLGDAVVYKMRGSDRTVEGVVVSIYYDHFCISVFDDENEIMSFEKPYFRDIELIEVFDCDLLVDEDDEDYLNEEIDDE